MKKLLLIAACFALLSCGSESEDPTPDNNGGTEINDNKGNNDNNQNGNSDNNNGNSDNNNNNSSQSADLKDGYITTYDKSGDYPWPLPKMADGYYNTAPAVCFLKDFLLGTAYELHYGDNVINVIAKDLCPDEGTTWFDLERDGWNKLTSNHSPDHLPITWREIPYNTDKNIEIRVKSGSNAWFLGVFVFNGRYAVKKLEVSKDGKQFYEMTPYEYNAFWELQCPFDKYDTPLTFRITDKYNHTVTSKSLKINPDGTDGYDTGVNFEE